MTRSERLLRTMKRRGGMRYGEMVRLLVKWAGHDYDEMTVVPCYYRPEERRNWTDKREWAELVERVGPPRRARRWRSFWSDNLLGGAEAYHRQGLLKRFCRKGRDGRWRVVRPIRPPFIPVNRDEA